MLNLHPSIKKASKKDVNDLFGPLANMEDRFFKFIENGGVEEGDANSDSDASQDEGQMSHEIALIMEEHMPFRLEIANPQGFDIPEDLLPEHTPELSQSPQMSQPLGLPGSQIPLPEPAIHVKYLNRLLEIIKS